MRAAASVSVLLVAAMAFAACGNSESRKQDGAAATAPAPQVAGRKEAAGTKADASAEDVARSLEAMAQGLTGAARKTAGSVVTRPVSFKALQALFPHLAGWVKGKPTGDRMETPVAYSQAEVQYTKDDTRIHLKIVDSGFHQLLLAPYTMFLTSGYEKVTETGYEKSTTVKNQPGWEKWDHASKHGELNAVVGERFLVHAEGDNLEGIALLQNALGKTDFAKLVRLK